MLANLEFRAGRLDAALAAARNLRPHDGTGAASWLLEGELLLAARQPAAAARAFEAAAAKSPSLRAVSGQVRARVATGQGKAEAPLEDWLKSRPADSEAQALLAELQLSQQRYPEATRSYEAVVAADPRNVVALNNLAWLYQQAKDSRALETARKAYEAAPTSASVADTYGWILVQSKKPDEGLKILRQAHEKAPENTEIQYHYAAALAATGDRATAQRVLTDLLGKGGSFQDRPAAEALLKQVRGS